MRIEAMLCPSMPAGTAAAQVNAAWRRAPDWLWVQHSVAQPAEGIGAAFAAVFPGTALHLSSARLASAGPDGGIGVLGVWDGQGDYGTASGPVCEDVGAAARRICLAALDRAGRPGEAPDLVWVTASPGLQDAVQDALERLLGFATPVHGGSARRVGDGSTSFDRGIAVSVLFPRARRVPAPVSGPARRALAAALVSGPDRRGLVAAPARGAATAWGPAHNRRDGAPRCGMALPLPMAGGPLHRHHWLSHMMARQGSHANAGDPGGDAPHRLALPAVARMSQARPVVLSG